jgi:putative tricarboxylic transport membrane protein
MGDWRPTREIEIVAGTPAGGGLDRVARALAQAITQARLLQVPVKVVNVPGDSARRAWTYVDRHHGDAHLVAISSSNLTSDRLLGHADRDYSHYTPIATLVTEYIAFAVRADSPLKRAADLLDRLRQNPAKLAVALSTSLGNPNHVAFAKLVRQAGRDPNAANIRVFDSALDAVADAVAGHADVSAVTAASVLGELKAGRVRLLAISAPARLSAPFADVPTWSEQSIDCVVGAWRGVTGPAGITSSAVAFWRRVLKAAVAQPVWREALARMCWSATYRDGADLRTYLEQERNELVVVLGELGLFKAEGEQ